MKPNIFNKALFIGSLLSLVLFVLTVLLKQIDPIEPLLILGFVCLALASFWTEKYRGFTYSLSILAAVSVSMSYPALFIELRDFKLKLLIVPLLQIIMFGMGSQMSLKDFAGVIKMPKGVIVGVLCQFTIMPIMGFLIATVFQFSPEIAAGIVLVGCSPSGLASNVMSFLAKANLALSITLTAVATLLSPLMTPFLMKIFAGQMIEIHFLSMMVGIFNMVILPICAGLIFNLFSNGGHTFKQRIIQMAAFLSIILFKNYIGVLASAEGGQLLGTPLLWNLGFFWVFPVIGAFLFKWLAGGRKEILEKMLSFVSMAGIAIIIIVITAAGRDSLMTIGAILMLACLLHNLFGYTLGYTFSKLLGMEERDCRTIALEVGMQNGGLASGLALQMGKVATVGLAPAIFGPMMNITGSSLATWWRAKPTK